MSKKVNIEDTETLQVPGLKKVRNRNDYKVELFIDGKVVVFPPHKSAEVPVDFILPANLGLYEV